MTKNRLIDRELSGFRDGWWPKTLGDCDIERCRISDCAVGFAHSRDFRRRTVVRKISLARCEVRKCRVGPAVLEDVVLSDVTGDQVVVLGAVFSRVVLRGRIGSLVLHGMPDIGMAGRREELRRYWDRCDEFYVGCDWALDIRDAEFEDFSLRTRAVPAHLVRRDAQTQVVIPALVAGGNAWHDLIDPRGLVAIQLRLWAAEGGEDVVIAAPKRDPANFGLVMQDILLLREAGLTCPD